MTMDKNLMGDIIINVNGKHYLPLSVILHRLADQVDEDKEILEKVSCKPFNKGDKISLTIDFSINIARKK